MSGSDPLNSIDIPVPVRYSHLPSKNPLPEYMQTQSHEHLHLVILRQIHKYVKQNEFLN